MLEDKYWQQFIKCGRVDDYIRYTSARRSREISEGGCHAVHDRGSGYTGIEHRGERPSGDSPDT